MSEIVEWAINTDRGMIIPTDVDHARLVIERAPANLPYPPLAHRHAGAKEWTVDACHEPQ